MLMANRSVVRVSANFGHEKTSVMAYGTLFKGSGIHHSNTAHQITHDMYISGYFMLFFDLTPDQAASEGHVSPPTNGHIRMDLKFPKDLPEALNCLSDLEYDSSVRVDALRTVSTDY
jgi:gamma-glutamylcyclotransferase (GGCT)/AIG2-like uncharacterized protein YtfP